MYAKVRKSMWEGSLAGTGETWAVFVYLLAHSDPKGFVDVHPKVISRMTGFSESAVAKALGELEAADFNSRTPDAEGRRIVRVDEHRNWGWHITNYEKYRNSRDLSTARELATSRQRAFREKKENSNAGVTHRNAPSQQEEVEVEEEVIDSTTLSPSGDVGLVPDPPRGKTRKSKPKPNYGPWSLAFFEQFWPEYQKIGRECSRAEAFRAWERIPHPDLEADFNQLMDKFESYVAVCRSENRQVDKYKHAASWLNDYHRNLVLEDPS